MRYNSKALCRKFNQFRKQNWSAPTTMSVFIIICMICIFSLEKIGLLHKEKNLSIRFSNPEVINQILPNYNLNSLEEFEKQIKLLNKENELASLTKETQNNLINEIILNAAYNQIIYETKILGIKTNESIEINNNDNTILSFFDV